jgi:hypothetical protein
MIKAIASCLSLTLLVTGCTVPTVDKTAPQWTEAIKEKPAPQGPERPRTPPATPRPEVAPEAAPEAPPAPATSHAGPKISRSVGEAGGVVLLWPRIIPATDRQDIHALAARLQARLGASVRKVAPGKALDVRPSPQRVCPQAGCVAASVGVLLVHQKKGCVAVGLVSRPGRSPAKMVQWGGKVDLKALEAAFRAPPESQITVRDFAPCEGLIDDLFSNEKALEAALRGALSEP